MMAVFTELLEKEVRLERMRPEQIEAAMAQRAAVYIPFGSVEWHGRQNPVGLDALKAHEQLVGLAAKAGGVVHPPVYFGAGGGHAEWPHSYMVSKEPMRQIVRELLHLWERDGFRQAILLSGHYPNRPEYLDEAAEAYRARGGRMRVLSLAENQAPGVRGDHAGQEETSSMLYLHPELVDMDALGKAPESEWEGPGRTVNFMLPEYRNHPCCGVLGVDPRRASARIGRFNTGKLAAFLFRWLEDEETALPQDEK